MIRAEQRSQHERWLLEITAIPTAAGREQRVIEWVRQWVEARPKVRMRADRSGNLLISRRRTKGAKARLKSSVKPLYITAHLDHPAFVVTKVGGGEVKLEFRGGVSDAYFEGATIDIFDDEGQLHRARLLTLDAFAKPYKRVTARLEEPATRIEPGDIGRWVFEDGGAMPRIEKGILHTHACDDLAAVAAALSALDALLTVRGTEHVGVLLTRAEEVGFIGAIAACKNKTVPKSARLVCLENSRSFAESPIGAGPIVRVGDKMSVFGPTLTNAISALVMEHAKANPSFKWQRKLMPGGTCEATTFSTYGYQSTCICLPLGNYHNMTEIDEVAAGKRPALVGPEKISVDDYHGMIAMLVLCARQLDSHSAPSLKRRMEGLWREHKHVLKG